MIQFPSECTNPNCRTIFASNMLAIRGDVRNLTLSGNKTRCPACGSIAMIVEGNFNIKDAVLEIISAPDKSREMIQAFLNIAKKAAAGCVSACNIDPLSRGIGAQN